MAPTFPPLRKPRAGRWAALTLLALLSATVVPAREPILGGRCEDCDLIFAGLPAEPAAEARIAREGEPGEPLVLEGRVTTPGGGAVAGIIVYAYHTDDKGIYPPVAEGPRLRHGRLRGWARTGADGTYRFRTIRPAPYPSGGIPAHIHMHVLEPGRGTYYIDEILFEGDPQLTPAFRREQPGRGGGAVVTATRDAAGTWHIRRDIELGRNIPDYPR